MTIPKNNISIDITVVRPSPSCIHDAYDYFCELHGAEKPMRSIDELHDAIHEAGLFFDKRSESLDWHEFFVELFESGWPFPPE